MKSGCSSARLVYTRSRKDLAMQIPTPHPPRSSAVAGAARRRLLMRLAGFGFLLAACASTSRSSEDYVVLESHKFT